MGTEDTRLATVMQLGMRAHLMQRTLDKAKDVCISNREELISKLKKSLVIEICLDDDGNIIDDPLQDFKNGVQQEPLYLGE